VIYYIALIIRVRQVADTRGGAVLKNGYFMRSIFYLVVCGVLFIESAVADDGALYKILETVSHDSSYFTQGLELSDGVMYESSGLYGQSRIRKYHPARDAALAESSLSRKYFAEGLTLLDDELFVLTWKENKVLVYDPDDFSLKREMTYDGEGWGLANNGKQIIMSNGSSTIYFRDPSTFEIKHEINVSNQQHSVRRINELEFAEGYIWANIWRSTFIVKINPITGKLAGAYDLIDLVKKHSSANDERVLNGIAWDKEKRAFWVTGKLWSERYLVKF